MIRIAWLGIIALALFAFTRLLSSDEPTRSGVSPSDTKPNVPVGTIGCSASACHGKPETKALTEAPGPDCWKSSAVIVHALDPHRKAYEALYTPLAKEMSRKLRTGIPAHEDVRCLACHTNPTLAKNDVPKEWKALRSEGVSCEACHGNASGWQAEHTVWKDWDARLSYYEKGFQELNQNRAAVCAGCHVGAPATALQPVRDMNHDMIAAGHPALDQNYETLLKRLPHHWFERRRNPDKNEPLNDSKAFEGNLKALHDDRISRSSSDPRTPVPELAEMNCVSCHHKLQLK